MNLIEQFLGGGRADEHRDFINRYQNGNPAEGYSDQEALQRYQEAVPHLSPDQFQQAAQQSFSKMSPEQRSQFGQFLQHTAQQQGINLPDFFGGGQPSQQQLQDPGVLGGITAQMHQQGLLGQVLGGAMSGAMGGFSHGGMQGAMGGAMSGAEGAAASGAMGGMLGGMAGTPASGNPGSIDSMAGGMASNFAGNAMGNLGGIFANPGVKAAVGGIAANAVEQLMQQHGIR